ncbi:GumC family protein [Algibacter sp. PT7-4]|uniref:GumC family protein n=1 Tax=Algibacter ulvanivorans TaxID=3400999 RepID=UPI003AB09F29
MENNNKNILSSNQDEIDIKKIILSYLKHWKWFVLSCIVFFTLAFFQLRYAIPQYNAYAKIMLVEDSGVSNPAELLLKDLGQFSNSESKKIEDEIQILKSRKLMKGVVDSLDLNLQFFVKGRFHDTQYFPNDTSPVQITFDNAENKIHESSFTFSVLITSATSFEFIYTPKSSEEEVIKKHSFGKEFSTPIGPITLTPDIKKIDNLVGQTIYVKIRPLESLAEHYKNKISISQTSELSKVINLSLTDAVANKAKAIINTLINHYNFTSIEAKNLKSNNTADFINKRIDLIATDLSKADDKIQQFKTGNKLTDITSEADLYLNASTQTEQSLASSKTQYSMINFMKSQISDNSLTRIPSNVGLADGSVNTMASKYNELLDRRDKLLKSSNEKNPIIVNLDQQLHSLKSSLKQSLDNSAEAVGLQIRSLENQSAKISSKIYAVPGQVRESRDIQREQGIKESLYLYLLQKREEATISLISTSPNAKIIDEAHTNYSPVSPNRKITFLASIIIGLCIPFGIIFISQLLDNKIHNKEDLEKITKGIMVLGEIPRVDNSNKTLIESNDRSILSESFRIIRTNFDFIKRSRNNQRHNNIIFITSTINGEGKSFFSLNMALTVANTGKKVLLIGADVRNPQIYSAFNQKKNNNINKTSKIGLTEYLADNSISISETINNYKINNINIDILLSGKVPPNPAELLMSDRMKNLFTSVEKDYDYVIVDTAPSMLVTDTLLISQYAGHTIYITRADHTEKKILNFAKELHAENKLNNMMLVVNDVKQSNFGYGARYGYYGAPEKKSFFKKLKKG